MIKDDPKETGDVINASKLGHANNIASVKVGTKTYMALSDANGKIWVASTTDGKDWTIVKEELSLTGSVSSMVVKDGTLNFYYAKDGALHLATASATDGWVDALTDAGQVLQLPDGANNGTVVYNDVNSQFQFIYVSADDEVLSKGVGYCERFVRAGRRDSGRCCYRCRQAVLRNRRRGAYRC